MEEEKKVKKSKNLRKLENKINKLTEKNNTRPKKSIEKKIMKLEKKKVKLEKWLKIKLPFRFLIRIGIAWLLIVGVCYGCSYVPILKEVKILAMAGISYIAPEPTGKILDIVTLNIGASNDDFVWLKSTLMAYLNGEKGIEGKKHDKTGYIIGSSSYNDTYDTDGKEVSEEYKQEMERTMQEEQQLLQEILGTTDVDNINSILDPKIIMKVVTNLTPELISKILDLTNLTDESKLIVEQDINRALKIIPKLNNSQMDELISKVAERQQEAEDNYNAAAEEERRYLEEMEQQLDQMMNR